MLGAISDDKEVDDPGSKVEGHLCFTVDHRDAVPIPVAGSGHATAEQQEWRPTQTGSSSAQFVDRLMCYISSGGGSTFSIDSVRSQSNELLESAKLSKLTLRQWEAELF